jgi:CHAT domain-containing protein
MSRYGTELADLCLAEDIKDALAALPEGHPLVLVHDATASRLPWETLCVRGRFVAKERGMHRRYLADHLSVAKWLEERRRDNVLKLLLVVNPTGDLDGAEQEGDRILELFKGNAGVKILARRGAEARRATLLADIRSGEHDVVHYAGHAFFDPVDSSRSGILCAGKQVLSGADLAQINNLPSLVFFNACEAGRIRKAQPFRRSDGKRESFEARLLKTVSFAEAFLRGGVANYIGTYWPVGDASAKAFGSELYARLLEGKTVGEALQSARTKVFEMREVDWADYIHYGNHAFVLKEAA